MIPVVELLCDSQCELGEGPFWHDEKLYWFDILQSQLHQCDSNGERHEFFQFSEMFSAGGVLDNGELLLASETALWQFGPSSKELTVLHPLEADSPITRSNDGRADRQGGFWISTMGKLAEKQAGSIYRFFRGELVKLKSDITIPNAICFSPVGDIAYFADSFEGIIYRWSLDPAGWPQGQPTPWVDLSTAAVDPDGAVVDQQGYLWNAQWNGSRVVRYNPQGEVDQLVSLPITRPTCPAFDANAQRLLITSARTELDPSELAQTPNAGGVFAFQLSVVGIPEPTVSLS